MDWILQQGHRANCLSPKRFSVQHPASHVETAIFSEHLRILILIWNNLHIFGSISTYIVHHRRSKPRESTTVHWYGHNNIQQKCLTNMFDSLRYSKAAIKSPKETAAPLETQGWCLYAAYQAPWYLRVTLRVIAAMNACSQTRNTSNASPSKQPGAESDANCWKNIPKDASALLNLSKKRDCAAWSLWNLMRWPLPTISTTNSVAKIAKFFSCPLGEYVLHKKKRRGPDNYCLILFVGDRSIIYPVSLKMVRFPPALQNK